MRRSTLLLSIPTMRSLSLSRISSSPSLFPSPLHCSSLTPPPTNSHTRRSLYSHHSHPSPSATPHHTPPLSHVPHQGDRPHEAQHHGEEEQEGAERGVRPEEGAPPLAPGHLRDPRDPQVPEEHGAADAVRA
ncbi:hypothetical protein Q4I32_001678, partial [Leishmania shawi]